MSGHDGFNALDLADSLYIAFIEAYIGKEVYIHHMGLIEISLTHIAHIGRGSPKAREKACA
ncbi:hypothetical protein SDC9_192834 [bioreactor metagenome]|uniref:Uncharacterized protein n=1 Tax=bioreactor metagenome TaxID=1076179 RepID=A0A645I1U5_9ZZZZ